MVSSRRRNFSPRPDLRSVEPSVGTERATGTTINTTNQIAAAPPLLSEKLPSMESTSSALSSRPLLLACQVCLRGKDAISRPVVTYCGHLFCWRCLLQRLPPEGPSYNNVLLPCPVCETPLRGGYMTKNSIIPIVPLSGCIESDADRPLPKLTAVPIPVLDETIEAFHQVAQELNCTEERYDLIVDEMRGTLSSIDKRMEQLTKSTTELSISVDAVSE